MNFTTEYNLEKEYSYRVGSYTGIHQGGPWEYVVLPGSLWIIIEKVRPACATFLGDVRHIADKSDEIKPALPDPADFQKYWEHGTILHKEREAS